MNERQNEKRPDIFDRLMHLPLLRLFEPFYKKHKEGLLYLFFGAVTTLVSFLVFWLFEGLLGWNELVANLISWVVAVAVAFVTNRIWVFASEAKGAAALLYEVAAFYASRVATFLVEEGILFVFATLLSLPAMPVKVVASVLVVLLNYVFSKLFVFRKKGEEAPDENGAL